MAGGSGTTQFLYDGDQLASEYAANGTLLRRYVHGSGVDDPLLWYEGSGLTSRRALLTDHQGSIVAVSDGTTVTPYSYDEYGIPGANQTGRFQYTGQAWIAELGMYHYKARFYSPTLGRFLQTDPIGYDDQVNLYAYVGNDPVNAIDPSGMCGTPDQDKTASSLGCYQATDGPLKGQEVTGQNTISSSDPRAGASALYHGGHYEGDPANPTWRSLAVDTAIDLGIMSAGILAGEIVGPAVATVRGLSSVGSNGGVATTTVGHWMSQAEFTTMLRTGRVFEGAGGRTFVTNPANPAAYTAARPGSVFAEFSVPTSSLRAAGRSDWAVIPGPNVTTRLYGPAPANMPPATCIVCRINGR